MRTYLKPMSVFITLICLMVICADLHGQDKPTPQPTESEVSGTDPAADLKAAVEDEWKADLQFNPPTIPQLPNGKPFRFSICTGGFLSTAGPIPACLPSPSALVSGGHNASYVFSLALGEQLPAGLHLDGYGVLSGTPRQTLKGISFQICVRQLNEGPVCKPVSIGSTVAATKSKVSHPKSGGPGLGTALLIGAGVTGAAAVAAGTAQQGQNHSSQLGGCVTQPIACTVSSQCACGGVCADFGGTGICSPK
jgi:hypothetical protein